MEGLSEFKKEENEKEVPPKDGFIEEEKAEKNIHEYLLEQGIDAPPIHFHVEYGGHSSKEDAEILKEKIGNADIFIPEFVGWDELPNLKSVANGTAEIKDVHGVKNAPFTWRIAELLENTGKSVQFIDLKQNDPLTKEYVQFLKSGKMGLLDLKVGKPKFEKALDDFSETFKIFAQYNIDREKEMLNRLPGAIHTAVLEKPDLLKKDKIETLLFLGAFHTRFYHLLKEESKSFSMSDEGKEFLPILGLARTFYFNKNPSLEMKARYLFVTLLLVVNRDEKPESVAMRGLRENISIDQVRQVYEYYLEHSKQETREYIAQLTEDHEKTK